MAVDDHAIKKMLQSAMGVEEIYIGSGVLSELRSAPIELFDDLNDHEKLIAETAFLAAAGGVQIGDGSTATRQENVFEAYRTPALGEHRTRAGLMAAAAALSRIPENKRSASLTNVLDRCGCNPVPEVS